MKSDRPGCFRSGVQGEWSDTWPDVQCIALFIGICIAYNWWYLVFRIGKYDFLSKQISLNNANLPAYQWHPSSLLPIAPPCCSCKKREIYFLLSCSVANIYTAWHFHYHFHILSLPSSRKISSHLPLIGGQHLYCVARTGTSSAAKLKIHDIHDMNKIIIAKDLR